jgi:hypothetical protein
MRTARESTDPSVRKNESIGFSSVVRRGLLPAVVGDVPIPHRGHYPIKPS